MVDLPSLWMARREGFAVPRERIRKDAIRGVCPTHGTVVARKDVPPFHWPAVVWLIQRARAMRGPYRCPECGEVVAQPKAS